MSAKTPNNFSWSTFLSPQLNMLKSNAQNILIKTLEDTFLLNASDNEPKNNSSRITISKSCPSKKSEVRKIEVEIFFSEIFFKIGSNEFLSGKFFKERKAS